MAAGYYLYVGSAFGAGGLRARINHHATRHHPHLHWHIDYLRPHLTLCDAWMLISTTPVEQSWCRCLDACSSLTTPIAGFGASDSTCVAHLFYSPHQPSIGMMSHLLLQCQPLSAETSEKLSLVIHRFHINTT